MAGKAFAVITISGEKDPWFAITNYTGGGTQPKTREVPESAIGGTSREEPTGGIMREDIELTLTEREDEGIYLDDAHAKATAWRDEQESGARRKQMTIMFYKDREFAKSIGRLNVVGAWCKSVSSFEMDRSSDDARTFTMTITHLGSEYAKGGEPTALKNKTGNRGRT